MKPILIPIALSCLILAAGCRTPSCADAGTSKLTILKAVYGVGNNTIDVTDVLKSQIHSQSFRLRPSWSLGKVDPAFGTVKTVTIAYRYNGVIHLASFSQNEEIILPLPR